MMEPYARLEDLPYTVECQHKKRIRKEEIAVPIAAIIVVIVLGLLMMPLEPLQTKKEDCATDACKVETKRILRKINLEIKPCDDFHQFACSRSYLRKHININNKVPFDDLIKQTQQDILELYNQPIIPDDHLIVNSMKMLFKVCKDASETAKDDVSVLGEVFKTIGGGWPLIEGSHWNEMDFDWTLATYRLRDMGYPFNTFLDVVVDDDPRNRNKGILKIQLPSNQINSKIQINNTLVNIAEVFGANSTINLRNDIEDVYKFADMLIKHKQELTSDYLPYSIANLQKDISSIDWLTFVNRIVNPMIELTSSEDDEILIDQHTLNNWMEIISKTSKRTQANYMMWMVLQQLGPFLSSELRNHVLSKEDSERDADEFCYNVLQQRFSPNPINILYAKKQLPQNKKRQVYKLFRGLKDALSERLDRDRRFSKEDKDNIKEKILKMEVIIGEPESYFEDSFLDELLVDQIADDINSTLSLFAELNRNYVSYLYSTVDNPKLERQIGKWYMSPTWYYMFYDSRSNLLRIPTIQVQNAAFNEEGPNYLIFATVGKRIGEQLSWLLAFPSSFYDKDGNVIDGWTPETITAVHKSGFCLEKDMEIFNSSTASYLNNEYQMQVIAAKLSYDAYKKWLRINGKETQYDTSSIFNQKQLFWISTVACHQEDYSYLATRNPSLRSYYPNNNEDLVDFPRLATYAIARSNIEFKRDFKCSSKTLMTTSKRCQLV